MKKAYKKPQKYVLSKYSLSPSSVHSPSAMNNISIRGFGKKTKPKYKFTIHIAK